MIDNKRTLTIFSTISIVHYNNMNTFAKNKINMELRIKEVCQEKGITISKLGEMIGVKRSGMTTTVNRGNPTVETLSKIADALNVPITDLFIVGNQDLCGHVEYKGIVYTIKSREDLEKLLKLVE